MTLKVIEDSSAALAALDPLRNQILSILREPGSASTVADVLGISRQKVNYHLKILEDLELVTLVEERPRRGLTERVVVASAEAYLLSSTVLGPVAAAVDSQVDSGPNGLRKQRLSADYLMAVAGRLITEMAGMVRRADAAGTAVATLTIDSEIRFGSADARAAFTAELSQQVNNLMAKYHDEQAAEGRWHRFVVAAHPKPREENET